jgi:hypothetical protein
MTIHLLRTDTVPTRTTASPQGQPRPAWDEWLPNEAAARAAAVPRGTEFIALNDAYRGHGGISRGEVVATHMSAAGCGGYIDLARRIVAGQLFSFRWSDSFWLPVFQFERRGFGVLEAPRRVLEHFHGTLDGWTIAHWYVQPNRQLGGHRPLDLMAIDLPRVLGAAAARAAQR